MKELIVAAMALGFFFSVAHAQQWDDDPNPDSWTFLKL
jgi:hypothetical protein